MLDSVCSKKDDTFKEIYILLVSKLPSEEAARADLEWQKDINEIKNRSTLLLRAVRENYLNKAKKLLDLGANPNIANVQSNHLDISVINKNKEIVSLLHSHGAEVIFKKDGSSSVFNSLEVDNNQEILDIILCHFVSKDKQDSVGLSPIHWARRDGHL